MSQPKVEPAKKKPGIAAPDPRHVIESVAPWLENLKPLTSKEAESRREMLTEALMKIWEYTDDGIANSNRRHNKEVYIWQKIDEKDTGYLVAALLNAATKNAAAAAAVLGLTEAYRQLQVGMILAPRFIETWQFYSRNGGFGF